MLNLGIFLAHPAIEGGRIEPFSVMWMGVSIFLCHGSVVYARMDYDITLTLLN